MVYSGELSAATLGPQVDPLLSYRGLRNLTIAFVGHARIVSALIAGAVRWEEDWSGASCRVRGSGVSRI